MAVKTEPSVTPGANSNASVSLAMGILSIVVPFLGLIIGSMGVAYSRRAGKEIAVSGETGGRLATSGFVCSIIGICLQVLVTVGYVSYVLI